MVIVQGRRPAEPSPAHAVLTSHGSRMLSAHATHNSRPARECRNVWPGALWQYSHIPRAGRWSVSHSGIMVGPVRGDAPSWGRTCGTWDTEVAYLGASNLLVSLPTVGLLTLRRTVRPARTPSAGRISAIELGPGLGLLLCLPASGLGLAPCPFCCVPNSTRVPDISPGVSHTYLVRVRIRSIPHTWQGRQAGQRARVRALAGSR